MARKKRKKKDTLKLRAGSLMELEYPRKRGKRKRSQSVWGSFWLED